MILANSKKRYNTLTDHLKNRFGKKVFKVALNAGLSCPNKDGKAGFGGCSFCSALGSGDFAGDQTEPLAVQFQNVKASMSKKWQDAYYIPYFQANTNTYTSLSHMRTLFEEAIKLDENIVMISIATRPDCLPEEVIAYLAELNSRMPVQIELGLQTMHDYTATSFNRGYTTQCFEDTVLKLQHTGIEVVAHIINGFPGETAEMMVETARFIGLLPIQGIKIHMLHIMTLTALAKTYKASPFPLLSLFEYRDIVIKQLRVLPPTMIIHRLTGDAPTELLIAPLWTLKKFVVMNEIDKEMRRLDVWQGDCYEH